MGKGAPLKFYPAKLPHSILTLIMLAFHQVQAEQGGVSKEGQKDTKKAEGARVKPAVSRPPLQSKASDEKRKQLQEFKQKMKEKMNEGHANRNADLIVV